jgi:hypothetical protein
MTTDSVRTFLLWCTIIDYALLIVWFLVFVLAGERLFRLHGRWGFHFSRDQFDTLHYAGMSVYKIWILLFNLVPLVALSVLR